MFLTWVNGEYVEDSKACLHVSDLAIQRGYGVFDFFSVMRPRPLLGGHLEQEGEDQLNDRSDIPFMLSMYLNRFYASAAGLNMEPPVKKGELKQILIQFIKKNKLDHHGVKLTLTGGYSDDGFTPVTPNMIIRAHKLKRPSPEKYQTGFRVMTHEFQRSAPACKTLDYRHAIALIPTLRKRQLDDVLYHSEGIVTEFPRSNFFMIDRDDRIVTPAKNILEGITRKAVISAAKDHFNVQERDVYLEELKHAKEAFLTSTTKLIMPVCEIDGRLVGSGKPGPLTQKISQLLHQLPIDFEG